MFGEGNEPVPLSTARTVHKGSGTGKQFGGFAREPIEQQPYPLVDGDIGSPQTFADGGKRPDPIDRAGRAPIDWIGLYRKARRPEYCDRARHMEGGGEHQPTLARLRIGNQPRAFWPPRR